MCQFPSRLKKGFQQESLTWKIFGRFDHTIELVRRFRQSNTCSKRGSPIASPRFQGRKPGTRGKVPRFGELQLGVGYGSIDFLTKIFVLKALETYRLTY